LIVLITPYLINDSHDAEALTDAFRRTLGAWAATPATAPASAPAAASAPASAPATKP
jgi:general secretion pathway protein D